MEEIKTPDAREFHDRALELAQQYLGAREARYLAWLMWHWKWAHEPDEHNLFVVVGGVGQFRQRLLDLAGALPGCQAETSPSGEALALRDARAWPVMPAEFNTAHLFHAREAI